MKQNKCELSPREGIGGWLEDLEAIAGPTWLEVEEPKQKAVETLLL